MKYPSLTALATAGCFMALGSVQPAQAELVKNGGFSNNTVSGVYSSSFINGNQSVAIADWAVSSSYSFLVSDGASISSNLNESGNGPDPVFGSPIAGPSGGPVALYSNGQSVTAPTGGGWFVAAAGGYGLDAKLSQLVDGFTAGKSYTLSWYGAGGQQQGFSGNSVAGWQVKIGANSSSSSINLLSQDSVTNWNQYSYGFTAASSSLLLEFLAQGSPSGQQPFSLLTGVSITEDTAPPSPSVPGPLPAVGFGMTLVWSRKLRRRIAVVATREVGAES